VTLPPEAVIIGAVVLGLAGVLGMGVAGVTLFVLRVEFAQALERVRRLEKLADVEADEQ
jgi:hypothetical protein